MWAITGSLEHLVFHFYFNFVCRQNRIGGVIGSVIASNALYRGFELRSDQTKDYIIGMCFFSAKHTSLKSKSKDW